MDPILRRELILDNYQNPEHHGLKNTDDYIKINTNNESCIDNLDIEFKIEDNKIIDINFDGEACAISTSATSIMIKTLIGKTIEEASTIIENYENMLNEKDYDKELIGELNAYEEIYLQPNRKKCALLPFEGVKKLKDKLKNI